MVRLHRTTFDRHHPWRGLSWAFALFGAHHTQLNQLYWSHAPAFKHASTLEHSSSAGSTPAQIFGYLDSKADVLNDRGLWRKTYKEFGNWVRLSALVSMTGYLEIYIRRIVALSLESDPGVEHGRSRAVDGAVFLKHGKDWNRSPDSEAVAKGPWSSRLAAYDRYFGYVPPMLRKLEGELEKVRKLRNGVAHQFGRETSAYLRHDILAPAPLVRLSEDRMKHWMGVLYTAAEAIDDHLATTHVGDYELVLFLHGWNQASKHGHLTRLKAFKKSVGELHGTGPGTSYCGALFSYYDGL